jgi:hypothetical protein
MIEVIHKTLVVVDLCLLRQRPEKFVGDDEGIVIPDIMMGEIAEAGDEHRPGSFAKWAARFASKIYIAGYLWDVMRHETSPNKLAPQLAIINWDLTREFRKQIQDWEQWSARFEQLRRHGLKEHEKEKARFQELEDLFLQWASQQPEGSYFKRLATRRLSKMERIEEARSIGAAADFAPTMMHLLDHPDQLPRYNSEAWHGALSEFPDRRAVGRWSRLMLWYVMCRAAGENSRNNWEDAHYAFIASYTGHVATEDAGLREAVEACFPNVRLRPSK